MQTNIVPSAKHDVDSFSDNYITTKSTQEILKRKSAFGCVHRAQTSGFSFKHHWFVDVNGVLSFLSFIYQHCVSNNLIPQRLTSYLTEVT